MHLPSLLIALLPAVNLATAQTPVPKAPGLTFLYSLNCTLGESLAVGKGPEGDRVVIPITGGTFSGPRINGISPQPSPSPPFPFSLQFFFFSFSFFLLLFFWHANGN